MITTPFGDIKSLVKDIEIYIEENSNKLILCILFKKPLLYFVKVLKISYNLLNKNRLNIETKKMFMDLENIHNIMVGDLIELKEPIIVCTKITEINGNLMPHNKHYWRSLDVGSIVMFLGIENDPNLDIIALKVLMGETIFFIHKEQKIVDFDKFLSSKFSKI